MRGTGLARRIAGLRPDLVLIDLASPLRDVLKALARASGPLERPMAMFVDRSDTGRIRFHMMQRMRRELETAKAALEECKVLDRAKGLMLRAKPISEDQAKALMRKAAMDQGKKIIEVANDLVTAELLK